MFIFIAEVGNLVGDLDVAHGAERGEQVEALKDEADLGAAHLGALGVGELREVYAVDADGAAGGLGEAAQDVERVDFPEPEGPTMATNSPGVMAKLTLRRAGTSSLPER